MRRKRKPKKYRAFRVFPLFIWHVCDSCGNEFKREWGWKAITEPYYNGIGRERFLCRSCASTRIEAQKYFVNKKWMPDKRLRTRPGAMYPQMSNNKREINDN